MRFGLAPLLGPLFRLQAFRRHFVRTKFLRLPSPELQAAFFGGYARCVALADFFRWLTPELLRRLERDFAAHPERCTRVRLWWGGRDAVVGLDELAATPQVVKGGWPLRVFPDWGHYPMIDSPGEWIEALADALAAVDGFPRPGGAEAE